MHRQRTCVNQSPLFSSRTRLRSQRPGATRREDTHNSKNDVEQSQGIRHKTPHATHACHRAEHPRRTICAPANSGNGQEIAEHGVHGNQDTNETGEHQRKEAVAQHASGAWEGQSSREMARGRGTGHGGFVVGVVVGRVGGVGSWDSVESGRHEAEDQMQSDSTENSDAVDIAVEHLAREEEESAVQDDVKQSSVEIAIIHKVIIDRGEGIQNSQSLENETISIQHQAYTVDQNCN